MEGPGKAMNAKESHSLMNSYERLVSFTERLDKVAYSSKTLKEKMQRTHDHPKDDCDKESPSPGSLTTPDIIDLFNEIANKLGGISDVINMNIINVTDMIE